VPTGTALGAPEAADCDSEEGRWPLACQPELPRPRPKPTAAWHGQIYLACSDPVCSKSPFRRSGTSPFLRNRARRLPPRRMQLRRVHAQLHPSQSRWPESHPCRVQQRAARRDLGPSARRYSRNRPAPT